MATGILERIHTNLLARRVGLTEWLRATPRHKKQVLLGPATERAVSAHLDAIDGSVARVESGTLGLCEVCHGQIEPELLEIDYTACVCIGHLSEQQVRHLETELEMAQSVQRALLPQAVPEIPGLEIAAFSRPAQIVGQTMAEGQSESDSGGGNCRLFDRFREWPELPPPHSRIHPRAEVSDAHQEVGVVGLDR